MQAIFTFFFFKGVGNCGGASSCMGCSKKGVHSQKSPHLMTAGNWVSKWFTNNSRLTARWSGDSIPYIYIADFGLVLLSSWLKNSVMQIQYACHRCAVVAPTSLLLQTLKKMHESLSRPTECQFCWRIFPSSPWQYLGHSEMEIQLDNTLLL